jgi:hypothetical protein
MNKSHFTNVKLTGKPRLRCEDNIRMYLGKNLVGCGLDVCGSGQGTVACSVNTVMKLRVQKLRVIS